MRDANGSANGSAVLVLLEARLCAPKSIGVVARCVEHIVLQVVESAAVKRVCAGLEGERNGSLIQAVLRRLVAGDELELADGVNGRVIVGDVARFRGVHDRHAVDEHFIAISR